MEYYKIHGIVRVSTNIEGLFPKYFECEPLKNVDLEIVERDFKFNKKAHKRVGLKFYMGRNKTYFESKFYGASVYRVLISDLEGRTKLYFTKRTRRFFGVSELIRLLLEIKLLQKGYTLIHGGAISKDDRGYLLFGWSGVGKSSTIFGSKDKGFDVLGDDVVILSKTGKIYCYPQKAAIFLHSKNIKNLDLPVSKRVELIIKYIISKLPPFNRYISTKIYIDLSTIVDIKNEAKLSKTFFLERGLGTKKMNKQETINKIISSTFQSIFEHYLSNKMFFAYCYMNNFDPAYIEKNMRKILEKNITNCTIIRSEKKDFYKYLK